MGYAILHHLFNIAKLFFWGLAIAQIRKKCSKHYYQSVCGFKGHIFIVILN